jgi:hypothetical protein
MTTAAQALLNLQAIHDNVGALADPDRALWDAEIAFKQAIVDTLTALSSPAEAAPELPVDNAAVDALTAKLEAETEKVEKVVAEVAAVQGALNPAAPPVITPTNTGAAS